MSSCLYRLAIGIGAIGAIGDIGDIGDMSDATLTATRRIGSVMALGPSRGRLCAGVARRSAAGGCPAAPAPGPLGGRQSASVADEGSRGARAASAVVAAGCERRSCGTGATPTMSKAQSYRCIVFSGLKLWRKYRRGELLLELGGGGTGRGGCQIEGVPTGVAEGGWGSLGQDGRAVGRQDRGAAHAPCASQLPAPRDRRCAGRGARRRFCGRLPRPGTRGTFACPERAGAHEPAPPPAATVAVQGPVGAHSRQLRQRGPPRLQGDTQCVFATGTPPIAAIDTSRVHSPGALRQVAPSDGATRILFAPRG